MMKKIFCNQFFFYCYALDRETRFIWRRTSTLRGNSEIDFFWDIPLTNLANGVYRVRHLGTSRRAREGLTDYVGFSNTFTIS
jgi:hypothetical protein